MRHQKFFSESVLALTLAFAGLGLGSPASAASVLQVPLYLHTSAAATSYWSTGAWGGCSVGCGTGTQTRTATCLANDDVTVLPDATCAAISPKPSTSQACVSNASCTYAWQSSAFDACTNTCGTGTQSRDVWCQDSQGTAVIDALCTAVKPDTTQACSDYSNCGYVWGVPSAWSACSTTCGTGTQTRTVSCLREDGTVAADASCLTAKPALSQSCTVSTGCAPAGGTIYSWGQNSAQGILGTGDTANRSVPTALATGGKTFQKVLMAAFGTSGNAALALASDGTIWHWGSNGMAQNGAAADSLAHPKPVQTALGGAGTVWKDIALGGWQSKGIKSDGTLWEWGYNSGPGPITFHQVGTAANWTSVATSSGQSIAVSPTGASFWGRGDSGMVANTGDLCGATPLSVPTQRTTWKQVILASSGTTSIGIDTSNNLAVCGTYYYDNTNGTQRYAMSSMTWATGPVAQASVNYSNCAMFVKTDGTLWYMANTRQWCNAASNVMVPTATQIGTATNWKQVAVGQDFALAIKTDGTLWAWGNNAYGQLGLGDTVTRLTPTQVGTATGWQWVEAENSTAMAIR